MHIEKLLRDAGLLGLPFVWNASGELAFDDAMTQGQRDAVTLIFQGYDFSAPQIAVPYAVTMRQARLALLQAGLLDDIDAAINSLPSPSKEAARIEWEYSQEVQRDKPLVLALAPALGLDESQLDALFIAAAAL